MAEDRMQLGLTSATDAPAMYRAGGSACRNTGYRGRVAICELIRVEKSIRRHIQSRASATDIRDGAVRLGMRLLRDDGIEKVLSGITTPNEVARVTVRSEA